MAEKKSYTFVILLDEDNEEYYSYDAFSLQQALYLLSLDGFSESDIVEQIVAQIHGCDFSCINVVWILEGEKPSSIFQCVNALGLIKKERS